MFVFVFNGKNQQKEKRQTRLPTNQPTTKKANKTVLKCEHKVKHDQVNETETSKYEIKIKTTKKKKLHKPKKINGNIPLH